MYSSSPPGRELQGVIIKRDALEDTGIFPASYIWVLNLSLVWRGFEQRKEAIMLSVHPLHIRENYRTKKKIVVIRSCIWIQALVQGVDNLTPLQASVSYR